MNYSQILFVHDYYSQGTLYVYACFLFDDDWCFTTTFVHMVG